MLALVQPEACPACGQPFDLPHAQRRHARMRPRARLLLALGILVPVALVAVAAVVLARLQDRPRDPDGVGEEYLPLASLLLLVPALVLGWVACRRALSRPRRLTVTCPACGWSGLCLVTEGAVSVGGRLIVRRRWGTRPQRLVAGVVGTAVGLGAVVLALEFFGVKVWPRSKDAWESITYQAHNGWVSSDLFYTPYVSKAEARKLGDFLNDRGFFDRTTPVSVVLTRTREGYVVSFFVRDRAWDDEQFVTEVDDLRRQMSAAVFDGRPVIVQLCATGVGVGPESVHQLDVKRTVR
jgi:hypothetical protein